MRTSQLTHLIAKNFGPTALVCFTSSCKIIEDAVSKSNFTLHSVITKFFQNDFHVFVNYNCYWTMISRLKRKILLVDRLSVDYFTELDKINYILLSFFSNMKFICNRLHRI